MSLCHLIAHCHICQVTMCSVESNICHWTDFWHLFVTPATVSNWWKADDHSDNGMPARLNIKAWIAFCGLWSQCLWSQSQTQDCYHRTKCLHSSENDRIVEAQLSNWPNDNILMLNLQKDIWTLAEKFSTLFAFLCTLYKLYSINLFVKKMVTDLVYFGICRLITVYLGSVQLQESEERELNVIFYY